MTSHFNSTTATRKVVPDQHRRHRRRRQLRHLFHRHQKPTTRPRMNLWMMMDWNHKNHRIVSREVTIMEMKHLTTTRPTVAEVLWPSRPPNHRQNRQPTLNRLVGSDMDRRIKIGTTRLQNTSGMTKTHHVRCRVCRRTAKRMERITTTTTITNGNHRRQHRRTVTSRN